MSIDSNTWFDEEFASCPVMIIIRGLGPERSLELAEAAWSMGVASVEVPIQTKTDVLTLQDLVGAGRERGLSVGAGTITSVDLVAVAARIGAAYTVSPGFNADVVRASLDAGLPTLPGVATATELQSATQLGLEWFKAFPARVLGPAWIAAMLGPFPHAKFVATGGVKVSTARGFLDAGARVVSLGSALESGDPAELAALVRRVPEHRGA